MAVAGAALPAPTYAVAGLDAAFTTAPALAQTPPQQPGLWKRSAVSAAGALAKTAAVAATLCLAAGAGRSSTRRRQRARATGNCLRTARSPMQEAADLRRKAIARLCNNGVEQGLEADDETCVVPSNSIGRDLIEEVDETTGGSQKNRREAVTNALAFVGFSWRKPRQESLAVPAEKEEESSLGGQLMRDGL